VHLKKKKNSLLKVIAGLKLSKIAFLSNFFDKKDSILYLHLCYALLSLIKQFYNFSVAKVYPAHRNGTYVPAAICCPISLRVSFQGSRMNLHGSRGASMDPTRASMAPARASMAPEYPQ
jgi:hypothetical protein